MWRARTQAETNFLHPSSCKGQAQDIIKMQRLLETDPSLLHKLQITTNDDNEVRTYPLHQACQQLHVKCVKFLIKAGAQIDYEATDAKNSLHYTIFEHNYEKNDPKIYLIVEEILKNKKINNIQNIYKFESNYKTDLIQLINLNLNYIIKLYFKYNEYFNDMLPESDYPKIYNTQFNPLVHALFSKNFDCVKILLLHGETFSNYTRLSSKFFGLPTAIINSFNDYLYALRGLRLFHNFGGNLWTNHTHTDGISRTVVEYLRDMPNVVYEGLDVEVENMMIRPLGLKEQCRLSLWRHYNRDYWKFAKSITDVPIEVKDFLNIEEL